MDNWTDFFVAEAGIAGVLAGLIFVGVSINLNRILALPGLPERALASMLSLLAALLVCSLGIVPGLSMAVLGAAWAVLGLAGTAGIAGCLARERRATTGLRPRSFAAQVVLGFASTIPYAVAGVLLVLGSERGVYWVVPAVVAALVLSFANAWVLLVEINR